MESSAEDKNWASKYLLDPLNAPSPASETGPGTHFRPQPASAKTATMDSSTTLTPTAKSPSPPPASGNKLTKNPYRKSSTSSIKSPPTITSIRELPQQPVHDETRRTSYPSPPASASPRRENFPPLPAYRQEAVSGETSATLRRRGSSLSSRFPGDMSHQPLTQLRRESKAADRASHLKKHHQIRPDPIDALDMVGGLGGAYHHEGPFDATYMARNSSYESSPVVALARSNREALKATPHEKIMDSLRSHMPLDGIGTYSPGQRDPNGHVYNYQPGENMMTAEGIPDGGGPYKRWPSIKYSPDDIEGKGEPAFSADRASHSHRKQLSGDIELVNRPKSGSINRPKSGSFGSPKQVRGESTEIDGDADSVMRRRSTTSKRLSGTGEGLKKRIGSIKKHLHHDATA